MPNAVEINALAKRYPGTAQAAVADATFAIRRGEVFGLLGPNGAGKTTTIGMLSGLVDPTAGDATIAGFNLSRQANEVKKRVGLVPQDLALYPTLSARDNLVFFGSLYGLGGSSLKRRVDEALCMVGLSDRASDAVEKFSGGMKRRVNIAAGVLHRPELLILDEPTVGVDPQSRNLIFENVQQLKHSGTTVLYTTHYMEEAERLCDRVAILDQGRIIALDTPEGLVNSLGGGVLVLGVPEETPESVIEQARNLPDVHNADREDGKLSVTTSSVQTTLVNVIELLSQTHVVIQSLEILEPNLETVFLKLTGKRLRD
jgi:ABC-2 type transport system ATP-binding protein